MNTPESAYPVSSSVDEDYTVARWQAVEELGYGYLIRDEVLVTSSLAKLASIDDEAILRSNATQKS